MLDRCLLLKILKIFPAVERIYKRMENYIVLAVWLRRRPVCDLRLSTTTKTKTLVFASTRRRLDDDEVSADGGGEGGRGAEVE